MIALLRRRPVLLLVAGAVLVRTAFFALPPLSDALPKKIYSRAINLAVAAEALLDGHAGEIDASRVAAIHRAWMDSGARLPPPPSEVPATAPPAWRDFYDEKGYVLLHAGWALLTGRVGWFGVLFVQALLSGLCVLLVYGVAARLLAADRALWLAAVYAFHPLEIWVSVAPDLPVWAVYAGVAACTVALTPTRRRSAGSYAATSALGALVTFCAVVRSTNLAFMAAASLGLLLRTGGRTWRHQAAFWGAGAVVLGLCAWAPPPTPTVGRSAMYHSLLGGLGEFGDIEGLAWDDRAIHKYLQERYGVVPSYSREFDEAAKRAYLDSVRADPSLPLVVFAKRILWLAVGYRVDRTSWVVVVPFLVLKLAVLLGLWTWWRARRSVAEIVAFVGVALTPVLVHAVIVPVLAIYMMPTIVLFSFPAAWGVFGLLGAFRRRRSGTA